MNFPQLVTSSVLTRALAVFLLFFVMVLAIIIAAYDLATGRAIPSEIWSALTLGLGYAVTILGLNFGVMLTPSSTPEQQPTKPGGTSDVSQP